MERVRIPYMLIRPRFLDGIFFCPRSWDSRGTRLGHPALRRQEPGIDAVAVAAAGLAPSREDAGSGQSGKVPGHRGFADAGDLGELADGGPAFASAIGEGDEALQCPAQARRQRAVQIEDDRDVGEHGGSFARWAQLACACQRGLRKPASCRMIGLPHANRPAPAGYAARLAVTCAGGFCFMSSRSPRARPMRAGQAWRRITEMARQVTLWTSPI